MCDQRRITGSARAERVAQRVVADELRLSAMFDEASHFREMAVSTANILEAMCSRASLQPWRYSGRDSERIGKCIGELLNILGGGVIEPAPEVRESLQRRIAAGKDRALQAVLARAESAAAMSPSEADDATSAFRVVVRREGDIVVASAFGVLSRDTHGALRAAIHAELRVAEARAVVVDLRCAVSALDDDERLMVVKDSVADPKAPLIPVGMVVPENLFEPTVRQCGAAWSECRLWVPFHDCEDAKHWARTRRPHWQPAAHGAKRRTSGRRAKG